MGLISRTSFRRTALALAAGLMLASCSSGGGGEAAGTGTSRPTNEAFITEYEELNGQESSGENTYMEMDIPDNHRFVTASRSRCASFSRTATAPSTSDSPSAHGAATRFP